MAGIEEVVGTARLDLVVNSESWDAAVARGKSGAQELSASAQQAFQQADAVAKRSTTNLQRYAELIGKSADEVQLLRAAWNGVDKGTITEMAALIQKQREETQRAALAARDRAAAERELAAVVASEQANDASMSAAYERDLAAANQTRRRADATYALSQALEFQEERERQLAMVPEYERELAAANQARRRADATYALSQALEQQEQQERSLAQQTEFLTSLERQAQAAGKTRSELLQMRAAELGVQEQAAPFIKALRDQETQLTRNGIQFNQYGLSAKQTAAALRQVPAQITDIFVSLQGGQRPLTVLLQQGGQLKDLFGGAVPALRALTSGLLKLITVESLSVAGIGVLTYAWYQAEKRSEALSRSLITTGQYTDETAAKIGNLAAELDNMRGVTRGSATEALAMAAQTGRIPVDMMEQVTRAALAMHEATGKEIKETIGEFAEFGRDPVQAVLRFNEAEHFLTREVLEQIQALQDQGNTAEAARVAMEARSQSMIDNASKVNEKLGLISGALHSIRNGVPDVWDWMVSGLQRVDEKAGDAWRSIKGMWNAFHIGGPASAFAMTAVMSGGADLSGTSATGGTNPNDAVDSEAARKFKAFQDSNLSREERQKREIEQIKATGKAARATQAEIDKAIADSEARYAESQKKPKSTSALDNALASAELQKFKDRLTMQQGLLQNHQQLLQAQFSAGLVAESDYYKQSRQIIEDDTADQVASIQGQIDVLQRRNVKGKDAANVQRELGQLEAQLAKVRADGATKLAILAITEEDASKKRKDAIEDYKLALTQGNEALKQQNAASVLRVTMGQREAEIAGKVADANNALAVEITRLSLLKQRTDNADQKAVYDAEIEAARAATEEKVKIIKDGYDQMSVAQSDWMNGVRASWMDFVTQTQDVAGQIGSITTNFLQGTASGITELFAKGKTDIKGFLADIGTQLTRFFVQRAVLQFASMFLGGFTAPSSAGASSFGNNTGWLTNGSYGGNGGAGFTLANAHGNMFGGGTGLVNQIVSKPTMFAFAKGAALGVAGEGKKPEAIMPLERGPNGDLGVQVFGGGVGGSEVNIHVTTIVQNDGSARSEVSGDGADQAFREITDRMRAVANAEVQRMMRPGGELYKVGVGRR